MAAPILRLPMLTWVPLLARLTFEVLGSVTRLLVTMPASRSFPTALSWLRLSTRWHRCMYRCFSSPRLHPERQGLMNNSR
ncbi:MAG: hypothetical protein A4E73_01339 [Syntrophaceae bacterium PtaU1.Bin231]|nr:MAG: hypothetical protein A4E73_01339 [Syntrophaceae bacterium PtaU1.Bin231]